MIKKVIAAAGAALSVIAIAWAGLLLAQPELGAGAWGYSEGISTPSEVVSGEAHSGEEAPDPSAAIGGTDAVGPHSEDLDSLLEPSAAGRNSSSEHETAHHSGGSESRSGAIEGEAVAPALVHVSIAIDASSVGSEGWPAVMGSLSLTLPVGSTVYDALRATGVSLTGSASYVSSIDGLYAGMYGPSSGWTYSVNGVMPMKAANAYELSNGDSVRWSYTR